MPVAKITTPLTKRTPSPGGQRKTPPFAPVSCCVGRMGARRHCVLPTQSLNSAVYVPAPVLSEGFPPLEAETGKEKSAVKNQDTYFPRCKVPFETVNGSGLTRFYPPSGGASRAPVRLCRPWRRRESGDFRAAARTHSGRPGGRRSERRNARSPNVGIMMPLTKRTPSLRRRRKSPLFGPVSRCVGRMGAGWHPCQPKQVCCHCRRCVAEVGDDCWNTFPPELRVNLPVESIAG